MRRLTILFAVALLTSAWSSADVIYTYVGTPFEDLFSTSCPPVCRLSGHFTLAAPLPPSASVFVTPLSFSFTDGLGTVNSANSTPGPYGTTSFWLLTDSSGAITGWNNGYFSATHAFWSGTNPPGCTGCSVTDEGGGFGAPGFSYYARVLDDPGTWTQAEVPVPEPSTLLLLAGGLLASRRRLRSRPR